MRRPSKPALIALLLFIILIFASTSTALAAPLQALVRRTLDGGGGLNVGNVPSLTLDGYARPVVAYTDISGTSLKLAYCDDPTCSGFTLNKVDDADSGYYASIKLDANGLPVISYQRSNNLYVAFCSTPACDAGTVTLKELDGSGRVAGYTSLQLDAAGKPIVAYSRSSGGGTGGLWVAHCKDTQCDSYTITHVDSTAGVTYTSMQLNFSGNPVIAYAAVPNVRFLTCTKPDCSTVTGRQTFDGGSLNGQYISLQLNAGGLGRAIYFNNSGGIRFLECTNTACSGRNITSLPGAVSYTSMVLNGSDYPVYTASTTTSPYQLRLYRCSDTTCSSPAQSTLDTVRTFNSSLVLDCDENPVVAYHNFADQDLKLVMDNASSCGGSPAPSFGASLAAPGPLEFAAATGASEQLSIDVYNQVHATDLDVSLTSISAGYSIVSGLPITGHESGAATITVQCDSAPQANGTLVLATNDAANPSITYNLTCAEVAARFSASPAAGPLAFSGSTGTAPQLSIDVTNTGTATSQLDVSLASLSAGYTLLSGLPISGLLPTDPATTLAVQCDSVPQSPGTLVLTTNDASQPTVTYNVTCQIPSVGGSGSSGDGASGSDTTAAAASTALAPAGATSLQLGRLPVSLPAEAIPPGQTGCELTLAQLGGSAAYGFTLDDAVFDVKVHCDSGELSIFLAPLTICIQPADGNSNNKLVYHSHNGGSFQAMNAAVTQPGYVCGQTRLLSLFTLGQLALPDTGFAPGRTSVLPAQPAEQAYAAANLGLSIPKLGVELSIVGVPQGINGWDVSWLSSGQAGYLYGTSFPTWQGNSVLTAHVWNADNTPGPFFALKSLQHGDRFSVSAYGNTYVYEVRSNQLVLPSSLTALRSSDYSLITLITCESFSQASDNYLYRRAVQAVLVEVN